MSDACSVLYGIACLILATVKQSLQYFMVPSVYLEMLYKINEELC